MRECNDLMFSIIVPAYQVENYIEDCIESIEKQNFTSYEIIIVDDGSKDATPEICETLKGKYNNIKVIHQENQGLSEARNSGLKVAVGNYVVFVDGDDTMAQEALVHLVDCIYSYNQPDVVANRIIMHFEENNEVRECKYSFDANVLDKLSMVQKYRALQNLKECNMGAWMFCVKMDYLMENDLYFYKGILHEDEEWVPRVIFYTEKIGFNNFPIYEYRIAREGSITASPNIKKLFDKIQIIDMHKKRFKEPEFSNEIVSTMNFRIQKLLFGTLNESSLYKKDLHYNTLVKEIKRRKDIFKNSERSLYRICYLMINILGVKVTGKIFYMLYKYNRRRK